MTTKADYVASQEQTRDHTCHWPGCTQQVPPALWGCKPHWFALPKAIRDDIWAAYRPGQEIDMNPSQAYLVAAEAAQKYIEHRLAERDPATLAPSQVSRKVDNVTLDLFGDQP